MTHPLSKRKVLEIFHARGTYDQIASEFEVSPTCVGQIKTGVRHSQVTGVVPRQKKQKFLSRELAEQILSSKDSRRLTAKRLGVSRTTVDNYLRDVQRGVLRGTLGASKDMLPR